MKITLPENISDITLNQFQRYSELVEREDLTDKQKNDRKISIFTSINHKESGSISSVDYNEILEQIDSALNQTVEFKNTFKMGGVEFGFIPNLDEITQGEFIDLSTYGMSAENLHKVMAVLFRPIKNKDGFKNYSVVGYDGTKQYAEVMKQMPLSIVNGALVFFLNLANELTIHTQKYMSLAQAREA
jgi:hypothetical protein